MEVEQGLGDAVVQRHAAQVAQGLDIQQVLRTRNTIRGRNTTESRRRGEVSPYLGETGLSFASFVSPAAEGYEKNIGMSASSVNYRLVIQNFGIKSTVSV